MTTDTTLTNSDIERINQRICSKLVEREVLHCISLTISHLAKYTEDDTDDFDYDDIMNLCSRPDYEAAWDNSNKKLLKDSEGNLWILDEDEAEPVVYSEDWNGDEDEEEPEYADRDEWLADVGESYDNDETDYHALCEAADIDADENIEAYEHWAVTSYFKDKLEACGEITGSILDFDVWGRRTTGQAISMDGIIRRIASDMKILYGQENCWADENGRA